MSAVHLMFPKGSTVPLSSPCIYKKSYNTIKISLKFSENLSFRKLLGDIALLDGMAASLLTTLPSSDPLIFLSAYLYPTLQRGNSIVSHSSLEVYH